MELIKRKPARFKDYDYSIAGMYFVTICTKDRKPLFWGKGNVCEKTVGANCVRPQKGYSLSSYGVVAENEILSFEKVYENVTVDKYVIMPNHIHMIIQVTGNDGRTQFAPTISRIIKQFKGAVTKQIGQSIWQKSFYDHIIRNETDYINIWNYIDTNPLKWKMMIFLQLIFDL